jgi:hypothetical protein
MTTEFPHPGYPALAAKDDDAKRSRKGQTGIGIGLLVAGAVDAVGMVWLYSQYGSYPHPQREREGRSSPIRRP